jgi:hypothetical protein
MAYSSHIVQTDLKIIFSVITANQVLRDLIGKLILTLQHTLCTYVTRAFSFHPSVCLRVGMLSNKGDS